MSMYPTKSVRGEKLRDVIQRHIFHYAEIGKSSPKKFYWATNHADALCGAHEGSHGLWEILHGLKTYADKHLARYESPIGEDGVLGDGWLDMLAGFKVLLDGEIGKFDGGALDGLLYDMARAAGFDEFNGEKL